MAHRGEAQRLSGLTDAQRAGLERGREKGTNHRAGYKHRDESRKKIAASVKAFWAANPGRLIERGEKLRGDAHYRWKGGSSRLNASIRRMTENRKWMDAVKARDGACLRCGVVDELEAHHRTPLADLIASLGIRSRDDARANAAVLWALDNGETLCRGCHFEEHGRRRYAD